MEGTPPLRPVVRPAPALVGLTVADHPTAWRAGGFTVDHDGACRTGTVTVALVGGDQGHGNGAAPRGRAAHPNGATVIDHVVMTIPEDAVQPGHRIATLRTRDLAMSVPTAFLSAGRAAPG